MSKDDVEINASINRMYNSGGGVVQLTEGTFYIDDPIVLKSNVSLVGRGTGTKIIRTSYSTAANYVQIIGALDATNDITNVGIKYINFVSISSSLTSIEARVIEINHATGVTIKNCTFTDSIYGDVITSAHTDNFDLLNNVWNNCSGRCFYGVSGTKHNIMNNQITNVGNGILVEYIPSCLIANNNISNVSTGSHWGTAIKANFSSCRVTNNMIKNTHEPGIWLYGLGGRAEGSVITNNNISSAGNGIATESSVGSSIISNNTIFSCDNYGIYIGTYGYATTVTDNNIISCGIPFWDAGTLTTSKGNTII